MRNVAVVVPALVLGFREHGGPAGVFLVCARQSHQATSPGEWGAESI